MIKQKLNDFFKLTFIYIFFIIISTILFVALFWIEFFNFFDVLFLKYFILLIITTCVIFILLLFLKKINIFKIISTKDILIISLLAFTFNNFIYGLIPFNTSRSVSVMIVGYLYNNKDKSVSNEELNEYIYKLYFLKENAVNMRIEEQIKIGNIEKVENHFKLTNKGLVIIRFMNSITEIFNTKKNYIKNLN